MENFKQTWWDNNLPNRFNEFNSWIGDKNAQSKVFCRKIIEEKKYKTLVDLGCGTATEYFAYKEEYPELEYLGVDSCKTLHDANVKLGVPMLLSDIMNTNLEENSFEVAFSRHVLEHQPTIFPMLEEMIRLASKMVIHVFFMTPKNVGEYTNYNKSDNLYHNKYNKIKIENFLTEYKKVKSFEWREINKTESALIIYL